MPKRDGAERLPVLFLHSQDGYGADSFIHAMIMRYLDRERFEVHLACSQGDGKSEPAALARFREIPDVRVRPTIFAPGFRHRDAQALLRGAGAAAAFPADVVALARYVRRHRIRVIHGTDRPRDAFYAVAMGKLTGAASLVHAHVAWSEKFSAYSKWTMRRADALFAISNFVADSLVGIGASRARVHTVLNGIDPAQWDPSTDRMIVRRELGIAADVPVLASVSRLFPEKGQGELLRALAVVRRRHPDVKLLVVGADATEIHGGSFTRDLKELARELGIEDQVVFTGPRSDVPRIMAACDVFTLPSFEEPFGLVFLEAMAMCRPVVAVSDGGTPEVVEHGRSGLLSSWQDVDGLAANILTLLGDPEMRARFGAHGRARVLESFTAQRMARDAACAYEIIVGPRLSFASHLR